MRQRRFRGLAWMSVALLPTLQACYDYVPIATQSTPTGQLVELQITDQGRVGLSDRFGPGLDRITARVTSQRENDLVVDVYRVAHINGDNTQWSGESVQLNRSFVASVKGRQLSATRTTLMVGAAAAVLYLTAGRALIGKASKPPDEGDPGDPPVSTRIPTIRSIP
jgi:hypothetical protein